ncbi:hypothetical protein B0H16DRAFT_1455869 [Mycena metata]|uniref:Uncharacterized protein n=1 Tax=Mycena metata TaxID=1033252 RepID=A0AAD7JEG1_9AGAR|nr:hypothetical protein B0H16DRAFT_1455869 [Mycena metata]
MVFSPSGHPVIVDLLTLAALSAQFDRGREIYPATLFLALELIFLGVVQSRRNAKHHLVDLPAGMRTAVIDTFPSRREAIQAQADAKREHNYHGPVSQLRARNAALKRQVVFLEAKLDSLC